MAVEYWGCGVRHIQVLLLLLCGTIERNMQQSIRVSVLMVDRDTSTNYTLFDDPYRQIVKNWTETQKMLLTNSWLVLGFVASLFSGWLTLKANLKWMLLCLVFIMTAIVYGFPHLTVYTNYNTLLMLSLALGFLHGMKDPVVVALLARWTPPNELGRTIPLIFTDAYLSNLSLFFLFAFLRGSPASWTSVYYLLGNLGLLWCVGWYTFGFQSPEKCFYVSVREKTYIYSNVVINVSDKIAAIPWSRLLKSLPFYGVLIPTVAFKWIYVLIVSSTINQSYQLARGFHYEFRYYLMYLAGTMLIPFAQFGIGILSDTIVGKKKFPTRYVRKTCNSIAFWGGAVALLCTAYPTPVYMDMLFLNLFSHCGSTFFQGANLNYFDVERTWSGFLFGLVNFFALIPIAFVNSLYPRVIRLKDPVDMAIILNFDIIWITAALLMFFSNFLYIIISTDETEPMISGEHQLSSKPSK